MSTANKKRGRFALIEALESRTLLATSGVVFEDIDVDGTRDAGEPGIAGITVFTDQNSNGTFDAGEPSTVTDAGGQYSLDLGKPVPPPGFSLLKPSCKQTCAAPGPNLPLYRSTSANGIIFEDLNRNGARDAGEPGLAGIFVYGDWDFHDSPQSAENAVNGTFSPFIHTPPRI